MSIVLITGSSGLIGSEAASYFASLGFDVIGIDNDMRSYFFGADGSTIWNRKHTEANLGSKYKHHEMDIRNYDDLKKLFIELGSEIALIIHAAAQPSHDWASKEPLVDFAVNANGTLNLLECFRHYASQAVFIYMSTNKVYGDRPNSLPLIELESRWEIEAGHAFEQGISEVMSVDSCLHSLFGVSKLAADMMVQEYGRYFGLQTVVFRAGCLTGSGHSGTQLHGFLGYLVKCAVVGTQYSIYGYKGKQVRDNLHSQDLITAFHEYFKKPTPAAVYNIGGGRFSNCSMLEAIEEVEQISGSKLKYQYLDQNRIGDHIWWVSSNAKFSQDYPEWKQKFNMRKILMDIYESNYERWLAEK